MPFTFQIHPLSLDTGFKLSCEGVLPTTLRFRCLFQAIIQAAQIGRDLYAQIEIFDCEGNVAEILPMKPVESEVFLAMCA